MDSDIKLPDKKDIQEAYINIKPYIHQTPLATNKYINKISQSQVFFKCQNFQKTGSFKVRGAANKILRLRDVSSLCTHSSGNHAQAVAYMAQSLGMESYIVMPKGTPKVKKDAVSDYKAKIIECGQTVKDQQQMSSKISKQKNATFIHPYNDVEIIAGAASIAYEIYKQQQNIDFLVVPVGGGGLSSGSLLATQYFSPKTKVIGVQPFLARDAQDSIRQGVIKPQYPPLTLAEGVRTSIGTITFVVLKRYMSDIILVTEAQMIEASKIFAQRMKMIVEMSGAIVLAAILKDQRFQGKKVAAIISGGNMDLSPLIAKMKSSL